MPWPQSLSTFCFLPAQDVPCAPTSPSVFPSKGPVFESFIQTENSIAFTPRLQIPQVRTMSVFFLLPPYLTSDSDRKESACNAGDLGSIPGLGRPPGGGHSYPFQYSCLENLHGQRSSVGYSPPGHKESDTTE